MKIETFGSFKKCSTRDTAGTLPSLTYKYIFTHRSLAHGSEELPNPPVGKLLSGVC